MLTLLLTLMLLLMLMSSKAVEQQSPNRHQSIVAAIDGFADVADDVVGAVADAVVAAEEGNNHGRS